MRAYEKAWSVVNKEGVPRFYIRSLVVLEDAVNGVTRADTKKMSQTNAKSYTRVKQSLKKHVEKFTAAMDAYRAAPDAPGTHEAELGGGGKGGRGGNDSDGDSSDDEVVIGRMGVTVQRKDKAPARKHAAADSDSDSDSDSDDSSDSSSGSDSSSESDSEFSSSSEESASESESEDDFKGLTGRDRWVKRTGKGGAGDELGIDGEGKAKAKAKRVKVDAQRKRAADATAAAAAAGSAPAGGASSGAGASASSGAVDLSGLELGGGAGESGKAGGLAAEVSAILGKEWTKESLEARVREELASRGRRGTDIIGVAARLGALADIALKFGPQVAIPTTMHAVSARYDISRGLDSFLERPAWKRSLRDLSGILAILEAKPKLRLAPVRPEDIAEVMMSRKQAQAQAAGAGAAAPTATAEEAEAEALAAAAGAAQASTGGHIIRVVGDLPVLLERLHDEYIKALQHCDPHKSDYPVRIGDEQGLALLVERGHAWYARVAGEAEAAEGAGSEASALAYSGAARLAVLRLEHCYYKHESIAVTLRAAAANADKRSEVAAIAASAACQALEQARLQALAAHTTITASSLTGAASGSVPLASPTAKSAAGSSKEGGEGAAEDREAAARAIAAANDGRVVGEVAAKLAAAMAGARGKKGFATAAGVVARAVVAALSAREGGLLSAGAIAASRSSGDMETLADVEAAGALAGAEAAGVDLGDLKASAPAADGSASAHLTPGEEVARLAAFLYRHGDSRSKTRGALMHMFHHALHDRFGPARDLLHMSKLQDTVGGTDVRVQILFNRVQAQLGIAAFRVGLWSEAHECLAELCGSGHTKELLAQGISQVYRNGERDLASEREERRRLVPYHMHIPVELVDAVHLTAAMLLEVPNIAAAEHDTRRRETSRTFRRNLDAIDSRAFVGPPETTRDHIMMAGLALAEGEWTRAADMVGGLRVWELWTSRGGAAIMARLRGAVQEAGLVTYLHTYAPHYDSLRCDDLAAMFGLPAPTVSGVVSRLIHAGELDGKWDGPTGTLVMHRAPPSKLQSLALEFADRVAALAESNERSFGLRTGSGMFTGGDFGGRGRDFGGDGSGQYRRRQFDPRQAARGVAPGAPLPRPGGGGRGGGRGGFTPGTRGYASGRREYRQRGY